MGLGDAVWLNGAVRYFSKIFKTVKYPCQPHYVHQIKWMFSDLDNIVIVPEGRGDKQWFEFEEAKGCMICTSAGYMTHTPHADYDLYPHCFYDDMRIPREIRTTHFYIPRPPDSCVPPDSPYIFLHEETSGCKTEIFNKLDTDLFVIDPSKNQYKPGHPFYEKAQEFLNKPTIFHYMDVIENAEEFHGVDSSISCLAAQLDLSRVKVRKCHLVRSKCIENLGFFEIV
jgi:hypothetical protein